MALLALAWEHAGLRSVFGDTGFQVFKWVNEPRVVVEAHRYSAILPQLVVKLLKLGGAGLATLVKASSLAHVLVGYCVFLVCLYAFRAHRAAVGAALAAVLCTRLTFYGPVLEANYLLSYPFLVFAALERWRGEALGARRWVALLLLSLPTILVHPLGWVVLALGVVFLAADGWITYRGALYMVAGGLACFLLARQAFPPTAYEQGQYGLLRDLFVVRHGWASWDFLWGHTVRYTTTYLPGLLVFLAVLAAYASMRRWRSVLVLAAGVMGFLGLMLLVYRDGDDALMMDRAFLPVATLVALPAAILLSEAKGRWRLWGIGALAAVLFIKVRDVSFASRPFGQQYAFLEEFVTDVKAAGLDRVEVTGAQLRERGIEEHWAFPFSALLISSLEGPEHSVAIRLADPGTTPGPEDHGEAHPSPTLDLAERVLDHRYFGSVDGRYEALP